MVVSSAKLTILISWIPICTPFTLFSAIMKLASTTAAIIYSSIKRGHPCRTPRIMLKGSDSRPFIFIIDYYHLYEFFTISDFFQCQKDEVQSKRSKALRKSRDITDKLLFSLLDASMISRIVERVWRMVVFLIAAVWFSPIVLSKVCCIRFLRVAVQIL